jgi:hypothetical protein
VTTQGQQYSTQTLAWVRRVLGKSDRYRSAEAFATIHSARLTRVPEQSALGDVALFKGRYGDIGIVVMTEPLLVLRLDRSGHPRVHAIDVASDDFLGTCSWDEKEKS